MSFGDLMHDVELRVNGQPAPKGTKTVVFYDQIHKQWRVSIDFPEVRRADEIIAKRADSLGAQDVSFVEVVR